MTLKKFNVILVTIQPLLEYYMFESLEIRRAANGFILVVTTEEDAKEFVYDTERKLVRVVKQYLGERVTTQEAE